MSLNKLEYNVDVPCLNEYCAACKVNVMVRSSLTELLHIVCVIECADIWTLSTDTNVNGGYLSASSSNIEDCQLACVYDENCNGIDWNPTNVIGRRCWLIYPWSGRRNNGTSYGVFHYDLVRRPGCPLGKRRQCYPLCIEQTWNFYNDQNLYVPWHYVQKNGIFSSPRLRTSCLSSWFNFQLLAIS
jgi:hypothetical protein